MNLKSLRYKPWQTVGTPKLVILVYCPHMNTPDIKIVSSFTQFPRTPIMLRKTQPQIRLTSIEEDFNMN